MVRQRRTNTRAGQQPLARRLAPTNGNSGLMSMIQSAVSRALGGQGALRPRPNSAPYRRRARQSMMQTAAVHSIPRALLPKQERFVRGAPTAISLAPRGHGHYDAFARKPETMVLASQVGPCTLVEGYAHVVVRGLTPVDGLFDLWSQGSPGAGPGSYGTPQTASVSGNPAIILFNPGSSTEHIANVYQLKTINTPNGPRVVVNNEPLRASALAGIGAGAVDLKDPVFTGEVQQQFSGGSAIAASTNSLAGVGGITGAAESIPLRGSIRVRNITEHRNVGGDVRIMRYNGSLNIFGHAASSPDTYESYIAQNGEYSTSSQQWHWDGSSVTYSVPDSHSRSITVESFLEIVDMLRDSSRSLPLSGHDLVTCHQTNTYPADFVRSHTFRFDDDFVETVNTPKYNSVIILIDDFSPSTGEGTAAAPNNTYSITCQVQRAARFKPGTLLHNKAVNLRANAQNHSSASLAESMKAYATPVKDLAETALSSLRSRAFDKLTQAVTNPETALEMLGRFA